MQNYTAAADQAVWSPVVRWIAPDERWTMAIVGGCERNDSQYPVGYRLVGSSMLTGLLALAKEVVTM